MEIDRQQTDQRETKTIIKDRQTDRLKKDKDNYKLKLMAERINLIPERCQYKDKQANKQTERGQSLQSNRNPEIVRSFFINLCQKKKDFSSLCLTTAQKVSEKKVFYLCLVRKY